MIYAVGRIYNGFMHATRYHYHHYADLLICIQHIWWKILWYKWILGIICQECLYDVMSSPSLGDRGDIFMTYRIIIIKPEVSIFPFVVIFFRGCVSEAAVPSYVVGFIYIRESLVLFLVLLCSIINMCANDRVHYDPMVIFVCLQITLLHYHHYADVSEGIELLKCLSVHFVECVSPLGEKYYIT